MSPNIVNYNSLIEACGNARDCAAANAYFDRMRQVGPD
jgi:pentatricopeptide repeat protein